MSRAKNASMREQGGTLGEPLLPSAASPPPAGAFPSRPWWMVGDDENGGSTDDAGGERDGDDGGGKGSGLASTDDQGAGSGVAPPPPSAAPCFPTARRRRTTPRTSNLSSSTGLDGSTRDEGLRSRRRPRGSGGRDGDNGDGGGGGGRILDRSGRFHQSRGRWSISNSARVDSETVLALATGNLDESDRTASDRGRYHHCTEDEDEYSPDHSDGRQRRRRPSILSSVRTRPRSARSYVRGGRFSPRRCWDDWFHTLAHTPTVYLMLILFTCYTLTIFWFAFLYWFVSREFKASEIVPASMGTRASWGLRGGIGDSSADVGIVSTTQMPAASALSAADGSFCGMDITTPTEALYFSLSTMTTIGYGVSDYYFGDCLTPFVLVLFQVFTAILFDSCAIGLLFTRMSRGQKRGRTIIFSDSSVIRRVRGRLYWMCRVGELRRKHHIVDARVRAYCVRHERHPDPWARPSRAGNQQQSGDLFTDGGRTTSSPIPIETSHYQTRPLRLVTPDDEIGSNVLMSLPAVIVHRLDGDGRGRSPLVPPSPVWYDAEGVGRMWPLPPSLPGSPTQSVLGEDGDGDVGCEGAALNGDAGVEAAGLQAVAGAPDEEDGAMPPFKTPNISNRSPTSKCAQRPPPMPRLGRSAMAEPAVVSADEASADAATSESAAAFRAKASSSSSSTAVAGASAIGAGILGSFFAGPIIAGAAGVAAATAVKGAMGGGNGPVAGVEEGEEGQGAEGKAGSLGKGKVEEIEGDDDFSASHHAAATFEGLGASLLAADRALAASVAAAAGDDTPLPCVGSSSDDQGPPPPPPSSARPSSASPSRAVPAPSFPPLTPDECAISSFLHDRDAELIILVEGTDEMTGGAVQARHSYTTDDVVWNGTFEPCVFPSFEGDGRGRTSGRTGRGRGRGRPSCVVDFARFHDVGPAPGDCDSCPYVPDWA